ncbi:MAG: AAA family ATPase [Pseudomonadota bacterium]|nr:AAA family ATPase [Pseudomonadota bacterium]
MQGLATTTPTVLPAYSEYASLVRKPRSVAETGLSERLLVELTARHLFGGGVLDTLQLSRLTALAGPVVEELLGFLRKEARIEVLGPRPGTKALRYALTDRGRVFAMESLGRTGYQGPAPVPLDQFNRLVEAQSVHSTRVTHEEMHDSFSDIVINRNLLDSLGAAMHSGRAMFVYGRPGSGKTYTAQRLSRLLGGPVFVPHAIAVGEEIVQLFDPIVHQPVDPEKTGGGPRFDDGYDARFALCERPTVLVGGELTLDMMEISHDHVAHLQEAPLQLKASNGVFMIDDLGRQRVAPVDLFNRWIVPLETRQDHLTTASGRRFPTPFDVILIFSTNLNPGDLADEAFLRRLGHKISFGALLREEYGAIWAQVCEEKGVSCRDDVLGHVIDELHARYDVPLLPCHPRDLIGIAMDFDRYRGGNGALARDALDEAWHRYFVEG